MVTAAGNALVCDERRHPDLFWACKGGGGGNFGINTEFTFRTAPVDTVAVYQLDWDWQDTPAAFAAVQALALGAPNAFSCRIGGAAPAGPARRSRPDGTSEPRRICGTASWETAFIHRTPGSLMAS
ncbi:hypothetical protein ABVG11_00280 [Streptomyces sp. HD1123-B1]|uniref:hypothetical protein n=1 Tax=Streptomyces huangiella TaxID=3228804 RepID=UPI003D7E9DEE